VTTATEVVGLVDHTKWQRTAFATFCPTAEIDAVVTDAAAPAGLVTAIEERGITVHRAETATVTGDLVARPRAVGAAGAW
jgi:DeoR/GlpR family transcriptional regulator of sugar metabolism